jgi:tetraacyldisaccharide 4'-kinase
MSSAPGPLPAWLRPLGPLLERGYAYELARRNRRFDSGKGVVTFDRPVLSVGNLSVGGTGKTPMVAWLVEYLLNAGQRPCIAMRGYGARDGAASDEAQIYASLFGSSVPIVAQPDRVVGLLDLFSTERGQNITCIVLDDGFQHRRIARDLDIVLIDAGKSPWNDRMLPAGWLREPPTALARAQAAVFTHATGETGGLEALALRENPALLVATCDHAWEWLSLPLGGERVHRAWLQGRRAVAACAIGNPGPFIESVRAAGPASLDTFVLPDHDPFAPATLAKLLGLLTTSGAQCLVVTQKDWSKLRHIAPRIWPCTPAVTELTLAWKTGREKITAAVDSTLQNAVRDDPHTA